MIILKVTKKQDFILSPENTFLEPQRGQFDPPRFFWVNLQFSISSPWFFIHFCSCKLIIFGWFQFKQIIKAVFLFVCFINTGFSLQGRLLRCIEKYKITKRLRCVHRAYREAVVRRCTKKVVLRNNSQIP